MSLYENVAVNELVSGHKKHQDFLIALTALVSISLLGIVAVIILILMLSNYISEKVTKIIQSDGLKSIAGSLGEGVARGVAASLQTKTQKIMSA